MYLGSIVEIGETERLFARPAHPYAAALLAAAPEMDPTRRGTGRHRAARAAESASTFLSGCALPHRAATAPPDRCAAMRPALTSAGDSRLVACHHPLS